MIVTAIPAPTVTVGQKIKALYIPHITNEDTDRIGQYTGQIVTVTRVLDGEHLYSDGIIRRGQRAYGNFVSVATGNIASWFASEWEIVQDEPEVKPELDDKADPIVELTEDQKTIAALKDRVANLEASLLDVKRDAIRSMNWVNEFMHREAENRDWCEQYDEAVETINANIAPWLAWEPRQREFEIRVRAIIEVEGTLTISATTIDEAYDLAQEEFDIEDSVRYNGFELRNIECEEA